MIIVPTLADPSLSDIGFPADTVSKTQLEITRGAGKSVAHAACPAPSPPLKGGEGWGEEAGSVWIILSRPYFHTHPDSARLGVRRFHAALDLGPQRSSTSTRPHAITRQINPRILFHRDRIEFTRQ